MEFTYYYAIVVTKENGYSEDLVYYKNTYEGKKKAEELVELLTKDLPFMDEKEKTCSFSVVKKCY